MLKVIRNKSIIIHLKAKSVNAIEEEHKDFANSILHNKVPKVSFKDGLRALKLAKLIIDKVNENS